MVIFLCQTGKWLGCQNISCLEPSVTWGTELAAIIDKIIFIMLLFVIEENVHQFKTMCTGFHLKTKVYYVSEPPVHYSKRLLFSSKTSLFRMDVFEVVNSSSSCGLQNSKLSKTLACGQSKHRTQSTKDNLSNMADDCAQRQCILVSCYLKVATLID